MSGQVDTTIKLDRHGRFLGTRTLGESVREEIVTACAENRKVILDFQGVDGISQSFADEVMGKLLLQLGPDVVRERIHLRNTSPEIRSAIRYVAARRMQELQPSE